MKNQDQSPIAKLRGILGKIPSGGGDDKQGAMDKGDQIRAKAFNFVSFVCFTFAGCVIVH
jgi:hypothetical protein